MSGVTPKYVHGPVTYQVVEPVQGGLLVEARTGSKVGVAAAGSLRVLGVATKDARPTATPYGTNADGYPTVDISGISDRVAVGNTGFWNLTYAANAAFGDALVAAAGGKVTPAAAAPDARTIIGYCAEPAGVTSTGTTTGLTRINR